MAPRILRSLAIATIAAAACGLLASAVSVSTDDLTFLGALLGDGGGTQRGYLAGISFLVAFTVAQGLVGCRGRSGATDDDQRVSQLQQTRDALRRKSRELEVVFDNMGAMVVLMDREFRLVRVNAAFAELAGATPRELVGTGYFDAFPDAATEALFRERLQCGEGYRSCGQTLHHPRLGFSYWDLTLAPLRCDDGRVEGALLSLVDVTERERALQALRASEERFTLAMAGANDGLWDWDMVSDTTYHSPRWHRMFELEPDESVNADLWRSRIHSEDLARIDRVLDRLRIGDVDNIAVVYRYRVHGREKWILDRATVVRNAAGAPVRMVGTAMDITERKQVERELQTISRLYGVLSEANKAIVRSAGREQLLQQICRILVEEGALAMAWFGEVDLGAELVRPIASAGDNSGFLAEIAVAAAENGGVACPATQAVRSRRFAVSNDVEADPRTVSWRELARAQGVRSMAAFPIHEAAEVRILLVTYATEPGFFDHERVDLLNGLVDDVAFALETLQKEQRRIAAETALQQAHLDLEQRVRERTADLEAAYRELESFSYSISHDLRGPLRAINGFCHMLLDDYGAGLNAEACGYLARATEATVRLDRMIDGLLTLSRVSRAELQRTTLDVASMARQVKEELSRSDPQREVEWVLPETLSVDADPALMRIVLDNLLGNAWKFTGRRKQARIELDGAADASEGFVYWVRDNGAGFHPAYGGRLFKAFHRAHDQQEFPGNGIGLATVARIIEGHRGRIWAESEEGAGATFYFTLGSP